MFTNGGGACNNFTQDIINSDLIAFQNTSPRFQEPKKTVGPNLGPGAYEESPVVNGRPTKLGTNMSKAHRFFLKDQEIPGPGSYKDDRGKYWRKESSNVRFIPH